MGNVPNRFISHNNLTPIAHLLLHSPKLTRHNLNRTPLLALLQTLTTAQDDTQASIQRCLGLAGDEIVALSENGAALRVTENRPCDAAVLELVRADLAGEGAGGLVEDVLGGDFEAGTEVLAGEEEVEGGWGDDDFCGGVRAAGKELR